MPTSQVFLLLPGFDPFRNHDHTQLVSHGNHTLNDGSNPGIRRGFLNKAAIELDRVRGQIPKIAQAGKACPEIIKSHSYAHGVQRSHKFDGTFRVVQQDTFGHFQFQQMRQKASFSQYSGNVVQEAVTDELQRRNVDGNPQLLVPMSIED